MVNPFPAGGPADNLIRPIAQRMGEGLKVQCLVDNRPGVNGIVGTELVVKSPPDGYTIVVGSTSSLPMNAAIYPKMPFDPVKDLAPISALSYAPPTYFYELDAAAGLAAARLSNHGIAEMVAKNPARLRGMATLPMQDPDAAIVELERVVSEYHFKGIEIGTNVRDEQLADKKFRPLLKTIEQLGCFVFAHPVSCVAKGGMAGYELFNTIGNPLDETIMFAHLVFTGALDDLQTLRFLIPHGGGYIPYQSGRFDRAHQYRAAAHADTKTSPGEFFKRFYFDALTHDPLSARLLIDRAGADHVVLGTDNPFDMGYYDPLSDLEAVPRLTAQERVQICEETARALLGE